MGPMGPAGFRRRGRRRGLVVGAAIGASAARNRNNQDQVAEPAAPAAAPPSTKDQLMQLEDLKNSDLITEAEYEAKKKQILGI